jgi:exodeoxyribonuclease V gamma subunit
MGGAVSFCTLMPMRAIPFRVVCLLGMNDGDYPRRQAPADFDLMAQPGHARPGDRSRREDDRYLFLEALASARDALYISWVGRNVRDNSVLPPSVLVGQLRDYVAAGWHRDGEDASDIHAGEHLLDAMTTVHPLQPFSRRYFSADSDAHLFTYAREWRQALRDMDDAPTNAPLAPWQQDAAVSIGLLQSFLAKPVRHFFNHRLKVHFGEWDEEAMDEEPFGLNGLERHIATTNVLRAAVAAIDATSAVHIAAQQLAEQGTLPPGGFGELARDALARESSDLAARWLVACGRWPLVTEKIEVLHEAHGVRLEDWLSDLRNDGDAQYVRLELVAGKLLGEKGSVRFDKATNAWVIHVVAHALGLRMHTRIIGTDGTLLLRPLDAEEAVMCLNALLSCLREGMRMPLPIARKTAFAWLQEKDDPEKARKQASLTYEGTGYGGIGEVQEDAYLARAWPRFDALETGGFHRWLPLYQPMLTAIVKEDA